MKRTLFYTLAVFIFISCNTQKNINQVVYNEAVKSKILIGEINRKGMQKKPFKEWYNAEYESYTPNEKTIANLQKYMQENSEFIIVLATWCPDSRREVPRFYKIIDLIGFDESNIKVYAVDRDFKANDIDIKKYDIKKVPTFIYYHYGYEAGRIIETPKTTIEDDLFEFTKVKGKSK